MTKDDLEKIKLFCKQCGVSNVEKFMDDCLALKDILLSENKKYNLTRIQEDHDYWNKHIAEFSFCSSIFSRIKGKRFNAG